MKKFRYRAYAVNGKDPEDGHVEAQSETDALRLLMRRGVKPFELVPAEKYRDAFSIRNLITPRKIKFARFFRDIDTLMSAGFTIDAALATLTSTKRDKEELALLQNVTKQIRRGRPVAEAFSIIPSLPEDIVPLLESGENSGKLDRVISAIADDLEMQEAQRAAFIEVMTYPAFLMIMMLGAIGVITFYLVPSLMPIFENGEASKPFILSVLSFIDVGVKENLDFLLIGVAVLIAAAFFTSRYVQLGEIFSRFVRRFPLIGPALHKRAISRYLNALGLLAGQGVPIAQALEIATRACPIKTYHVRLKSARRRVLEGGTVVIGLRETALFDEATLALLKVGEEANRLPDMFGRAAGLLQKESTSRIERLLKSLTPVVTILMGAMIGGLVISVMSAILSINDMALK